AIGVGAKIKRGVRELRTVERDLFGFHSAGKDNVANLEMVVSGGRVRLGEAGCDGDVQGHGSAAAGLNGEGVLAGGGMENKIEVPVFADCSGVNHGAVFEDIEIARRAVAIDAEPTRMRPAVGAGGMNNEGGSRGASGEPNRGAQQAQQNRTTKAQPAIIARGERPDFA